MPEVRHRVRARKGATTSVPVDKGEKSDRPPPRYFNPDRYDRIPAHIGRGKIERLRRKLKAISRDLDCNWNPIDEALQVWVKDPNVRWAWSPGWRLLFTTRNLDERVLAEVYVRDTKQYGGAMPYFHRWQAEMERDKQRRRQEWTQTTRDMAKEKWDSTLIKNIGSGSKFANHHSGG